MYKYTSKQLVLINFICNELEVHNIYKHSTTYIHNTGLSQ